MNGEKQLTEDLNRIGETEVDNMAMFKLSYGLFVLSAKDGKKDNACIINTVTQITGEPKRISIAVNKQNYTHDIVKKTGVFTVSVLSERAPFALFERFGFASGRDTDKFDAFSSVARAKNGLLYLTEYANAFLSAKVVDMFDYGTHTLFIADVTEGKTLSDDASMTYAYYFAHTKPAPKPTEKKVKGFVCKICGYIYEGGTLPPDFICPLCKHGAEDFEPL
ncbi:MAG: flavin reductase, partial [Eubacteriales bacterium]|nr:flavin reductase [Eubacteriales bacterium]